MKSDENRHIEGFSSVLRCKQTQKYTPYKQFTLINYFKNQWAWVMQLQYKIFAKKELSFQCDWSDKILKSDLIHQFRHLKSIILQTFYVL
jgi:hypothetical protein